MRNQKPTYQRLRALGPMIASIPTTEALRAGLGAFVGVSVTGLIFALPFANDIGLFLIAPFGATAVLVFAVPNSPLAQPWPAIVGNTVAALIGIAVCLLISDPILRASLAVGLAITAMMLTHSLHPPGGAVALTTALSPEIIHEMGLWFALVPVATGTALLVIIAAIYGRATGRHYPFRQFQKTSASGTTDAPAPERLGLSEQDLTDILNRYRQSLNLGVEDLARLIAAAEQQAAGNRTAPLIADDIMSRDLITVRPETPLADIADLFSKHGFTSLPVARKDGTYLGVIFQIHLIRQMGHTRKTRFPTPRILQSNPRPRRAADIMTETTPTATPSTTVGALLPTLADGGCDAVPILKDDKITGIVTRHDLIATLARQSLT